MGKHFLAGLVALLFGLGFSLQPVLAEKEKGHGKQHDGGYSKGHGSGHGTRGYGGRFGMSGHGTTGHLIRGLLQGASGMGLTEDQINKLKSIQLNLDRMRIRAEADIKIAEREARALMEDDKASLSSIEAKLKESAMKQVSLRLKAYKAKRDVMGVLTAEQRKRVKMFHEAMRERFRSGKGGAGKGRGMGHPGMKEHS